MLNNVVDNIEQCGQQNIVHCCFHQARTGCPFFAVHTSSDIHSNSANDTSSLKSRVLHVHEIRGKQKIMHAIKLSCRI